MSALGIPLLSNDQQFSIELNVTFIQQQQQQQQQQSKKKTKKKRKRNTAAAEQEEEEREELRRGIETRLRIVCEMLNNDLKHHYTNSTNRNSAGSHNSGHSSSSGVHSLPLPTTQLRVVEVAEMTRLLTTPIPQKILNTNPTAHLPDALKCWSVSSNHFLCSSGFVEDSV